MAATAERAQAPKTDPEAMRQRLVMVASWILKGLPRAKAVEAAMQEWQVRRRTGQDYVQRAVAHLKAEAAELDVAFLLQLSQLQREQLYGHLATQLERVQSDPQATVRIVIGMARLLDSRERTALRLQALEQEKTKSPKLRTGAAGDASRQRAQGILQEILATSSSCLASQPASASAPPRKDLPHRRPQQRADGPAITIKEDPQGALREKQPTAQTAPAPDRKASKDKRMRPMESAAPSRASCATEISKVDNKPPGRAPPKGVS
jgi:hypothetical protein